MMANVKLSKHEFELVTSADFILTKNAIIKRVYELFGDLSEQYMKLADITLPPEVLSISPKIAKGENYRELPWVMLDYPRVFSQQNVFAIRSFFWWGNFFSITLQLHGVYKEFYQSSIQKHLAKNNWWYCLNESDAWQHHFEMNNYEKLDGSVNFKQLPFLKLAKKIPLQEWDKAFDFYKSSFEEIISVLATQPVK
jgi:hypothetical protein